MPKIPPPDVTETLPVKDLGIDDTPAYEYEKEITVYITGFGPFLNIKDNPSYRIISSFGPSTSLRLPHPNSHITVQLTPHPDPIKVAYATIDTIIPSIYDSSSFDYILHVGAGLDGGYQIERMAWTDGYLRGDVDGLIPGGDKGLDDKALRKLILSGKASHWGGDNADIDRRKRDGGTDGWYATALDVDWIAKEASQGHQIEDGDDRDQNQDANRDSNSGRDTGRDKVPYHCKPSFNAGRYLCEYIYLTSLREACSRRTPLPNNKKHKHQQLLRQHHGNKPEETINTSKRVLFLHVPRFGHPYVLEDGQEIVRRVVTAMVMDGEGLRGRKGR